MPRLLLAFLASVASAFAALSGTISGGDFSASYSTVVDGTGFTVTITGTWTKPDSTANFYRDGFVHLGSAAGPATQSFSFSRTGTVGTNTNVRLFTLSASPEPTHYKFDQTYSFNGVASAPPGAGTNKTIHLSYHNAAAYAIWCGVVRTDQPGMVFQTEWFAAGGDYTASISVPAGDTASYQVVVIDADRAFADGGGQIDYFPGADGAPNVYDFSGYTEAVGPTYNATANGVAAGQSRVPGQTVTPPSGAPESAPLAPALNNPRYRGISGIAPADLESVKNTNAITGALKDLQDALKENAATAPDLGGTNSRLDTVIARLTTANTKTDGLDSRIAGLATTQSATNTKLDTLAGTATAANTKLDALSSAVTAGTAATTANGAKLDAVVSTVAAGTAATVAQNAKLDAIAESTAATNTGIGGLGPKLDAIKSSVDGVGAKVDDTNTALGTANGHLADVAAFVNGEAASQTGYSNATQLTAANSAAAGLTPYAGQRPTVSGALSTSIPSGASDWGPGFQVGTATITFGLGRMSPTMDALMVAGRSLLLAALCIGFMRTASSTLTRYTVALPQVLAQDTGFGPENVGPGVSQAKTYATAAAAVGIIFATAASMVALVDTWVTYYGGGITNLFAALNFPAASAAGGLDRFVPLAPALGLTVMAAALPYVVAPMYLAAAGVLRFIKT